MTKKQIEDIYLGKEVHVVINDGIDFFSGVGVVERVDDIGQLHGTWGGLGVMPGEDQITIIK